MHWALTVALMGLFLGYTLYTIHKRNKGLPDATRMFFERTGYRYAEILQQPLEAHVQHGARLVGRAQIDQQIARAVARVAIIAPRPAIGVADDACERRAAAQIFG